MTGYDIFKEYLELRYSASTTRQYLWAFKSYSPNLRSQEELNVFVIDKMRKRGNNPFYNGFLKSYIDCFGLNLVIHPSKKKINVQEKTYKFLTKEEVDTIISGTSPYISLMTRLFFETGLRLRELINTKIDDINIVERTISGIGKNSVRFKVKYSRETADMLVKLLNDARNNGLVRPFHCHVNNAKDHAKSFHYYLRKECNGLGIPGVHAHRFRHALGHYLRAEMKFDLKQIQRKLRHKRLETTSIYTEATQKEVDDKIDREVYGL